MVDRQGFEPWTLGLREDSSSGNCGDESNTSDYGTMFPQVVPLLQITA